MASLDCAHYRQSHVNIVDLNSSYHAYMKQIYARFAYIMQKHKAKMQRERKSQYVLNFPHCR